MVDAYKSLTSMLRCAIVNSGLNISEGSQKMAETTEKTVESWPFHDAIVLMIDTITNISEMNFASRLLSIAEITANHDKIAEAWKAKRAQLETRECWVYGFSVLGNIKQQKKEAEAKAAAKEAAQPAYFDGDFSGLEIVADEKIREDRFDLS